MATDKQRFSITVDDNLYKRIDDFRFARRLKSQSKAVNELMEMGFDALMGKEVSLQPSFSSFEISMIEKYRNLDDHGKEIVEIVLEKEYERFSLAEKDLQKKSKEISDRVSRKLRAQNVD